jgi:signal transduction histidine kinase
MERRIVICAPTGQDAALTSRVYQSVGIGSIVCPNVAELMEQMGRGAGGLLLVEEVISGPVMWKLAAHIAAQPTWSDLPVLLMSQNGADSADVQMAVEHLGNVTLLERPVRTIALIAATRSAIRARERQYLVRDADQRKDEFLATLAHELRNPLAPIRTSMAILKNLQPDSAQITGLRQVVDRQVTHLTRLVDDLLDVARITRGKVVLKKEHILLQSVLDHAIEISSSAMSAKNQLLQVIQPDTEHVLYADHARLVQSVANLLVNAAKFTPEQGQIVLSAAVEGKSLTFSVRDNGIGLEKASLRRIFDLFAQTPVPGEAPAGLGIGLSLARQFSEMHEGSLHATSAGLGQGSEFVLTLPVAVDVAVEGALGPGTEIRLKNMQDQSTHADSLGTPNGPDGLISPGHPGGETTSGARKVLVVDDNADAADTLGALLGMDGFDVQVVYDGMAAVNAAMATIPDVVVMDIGMPGIDGYEAAHMLREQPGGKKMILVALTGWGQSTDRHRATQAGFDHHLVKPVDYEQLTKCLQ